MRLRPTVSKRLLVTAGPTREHIDPVRFISNYSTGQFGYEIARAAKERGHLVTLVSGPTALKAPNGVRLVRVESTMDMKRAVLKEFPKSECVIMAAAVSDWRVRTKHKRKIKRRSNQNVLLELVENPDILKELGSLKRERILVGFSLETEDLEKNAMRKLKEKNLDLIIATHLKAGSTVFGDRAIDILMIDRFGNRGSLFGKSKRELAHIILDKVEEFKI